MHGKEFVLDLLRTYFIVVTLINAAMWIMGVSLDFVPENQFGYEAFAAPLIYGLAGCLPEVVLYSKRELKVKELIVRKVLQFFLVEVLVLMAAFYGSEGNWRSPELIGSVAFSIFIIYVLATLFDWLQNYIAALRMTEELVQFQKKLKK